MTRGALAHDFPRYQRRLRPADAHRPLAHGRGDRRLVRPRAVDGRPQLLQPLLPLRPRSASQRRHAAARPARRPLRLAAIQRQAERRGAVGVRALRRDHRPLGLLSLAVRADGQRLSHVDGRRPAGRSVQLVQRAGAHHRQGHGEDGRRNSRAACRHHHGPRAAARCRRRSSITSGTAAVCWRACGRALATINSQSPRPKPKELPE